MRKMLCLLAAAVMAVLIASPASAYVLMDTTSSSDETTAGPEEGTGGEEGTEVGDEVVIEPLPPTKRPEAVFFHCTGATKADNVNRQQGTVTGWDTTAPTQSVQQGAGCGFLDTAAEDTGALGSGTPLDDVWLEHVDKSNDASFDAAFAGTFTGNLDTLTFELHRIHGLTDRAYAPLLGSNFEGEIAVKIDGEAITLNDSHFTAPVVESSSGASESFKLSIQNLGFMIEEGDGTTVRTIEVRIDHWYSDTEGIWVWDTTEVPSGITFNAATLAETKLSRV